MHIQGQEQPNLPGRKPPDSNQNNNTQHDYDTENNKLQPHLQTTRKHTTTSANASQFDEEEDMADVDTVCTIKIIGSQLNPMDPGILAKESGKDPVISR